MDAERSHRSPNLSDPTRRTGPRSRLPSTGSAASRARFWAVGGAVVLAAAVATTALADPIAADSAGWIATSLVPGITPAELTLGPEAATGSPPTFPSRASIEGRLRAVDPLSSPGLPIAFRIFRDDPVEGLIMTWGGLVAVQEGQTELTFTVPGQEPGVYRLLAYHALTEPLALVELRVDGEPSALPAPPPVPDGWKAVTSANRDLVLQLPADFGSLVDQSSIVANPPPDPAGGWVSVLAESPSGADSQPPPGTPLAGWLEEHWFEGEHAEWSPAVTQSVRLPAGEAVRLDRMTRATGRPWSAILYAIRTPDGVGFLAIDGPTDLMAVREAELELIPLLLSYP